MLPTTPPTKTNELTGLVNNAGLGKRDKGELDVIAIDGKALRRSHDKAADLGPLFLVSAWAVQRGISLGQLATEEKSNEITAIPELLDQIEIADSVVTIDAAGCQKNIAAKIIDSKGNYVLALKGNQGTLHDAVIEYIVGHMENDFRDVPARRYTERLKGHGRKDELVYYQLPVPDDLIGREKWKGMKTIGVVIRMSENGNKFTTGVRYHISSLALGVKRFAECVRGHWGIENTLHWCLDVPFREDAAIPGEGMVSVMTESARVFRTLSTLASPDEGGFCLSIACLDDLSLNAFGFCGPQDRQ